MASCPGLDASWLLGHCFDAGSYSLPAPSLFFTLRGRFIKVEKSAGRGGAHGEHCCCCCLDAGCFAAGGCCGGGGLLFPWSTISSGSVGDDGFEMLVIGRAVPSWSVRFLVVGQSSREDTGAITVIMNYSMLCASPRITLGGCWT